MTAAGSSALGSASRISNPAILVVRNPEVRQDLLPSVMLPLEVQTDALIVVVREAGVVGDDLSDRADIVVTVPLPGRCAGGRASGGWEIGAFDGVAR